MRAATMQERVVAQLLLLTTDTGKVRFNRHFNGQVAG